MCLRRQVQGELQRTAARGGGPPPPKLYTSFPQAFWHVARTEGIRGLQGGLAPSLLYQLTMNGTRLGLYEPLKRLVTRVAEGEAASASAGSEARLGAHLSAHRPPVFLHNVIAAAGSGCIAAFIGSPFFLVKVRLQVQSKNKAVIAPILAAAPAGTAVLPSAVAAAAGTAAPAVVGAQHAYTSAWGGLRSIYNSDGIPGLFRGATASMLRVSVGSVIQLSSYDTVKYEVMRRTGWEDSMRVHFCSSLLSGFLVAVGMHPFDVVSTRMYNQPVVAGKGTMYSGMLDCVTKTVKTEGLPGLYKGFVAHYFRLGPHTLLTFVFWEQIKAAAARAGI